MSRIRPVYTKGMNDIRRLLDRIGRSGFDSPNKDWVVWTLLTALRGPDNKNDNLKQYSTARLRGEIVPNLAQGAYADVDPGELHKINPAAANTEPHFSNHFNLAISSLEKLKRAGR